MKSSRRQQDQNTVHKITTGSFMTSLSTFGLNWALLWVLIALNCNIQIAYWISHISNVIKISVGIATRNRLGGQGIECRWGVRFCTPVQTGPGAHPASCTMGIGSFRGGKAAGAWRWQPTPSRAEVKERVELYLYSPSGPSWPVLR
jgi:hypothetical protein